MSINTLSFHVSVYRFSYNDDGKFSQYQLCISTDINLKDNLVNFINIEVFLALIGIQDALFDFKNQFKKYQK